MVAHADLSDREGVVGDTVPAVSEWGLTDNMRSSRPLPTSPLAVPEVSW